MGQPGLVHIMGIGRVAIGQEHRAFGVGEPQCLFDVLGPSAFEEGETHFVQLTIDRPEIRCFELARFAASGLDRGLVHGLDP